MRTPRWIAALLGAIVTVASSQVGASSPPEHSPPGAPLPQRRTPSAAIAKPLRAPPTTLARPAQPAASRSTASSPQHPVSRAPRSLVRQPASATGLRAPERRTITAPVRATLVEKLGRLGVDARDPASLEHLMRLDVGRGDGAVGALRARVLGDPRYAADVRSALARVSDQALAGGTSTLEAKAMRLELLAMAVPESTRKPLMDAIRVDLRRHSDALAQLVTSRPAIRFRQIIVGGGPQGQTIANELHEVGHGGSTLVVDAGHGDGNFGSIRRFDLNSSNGVYDGVIAEPSPQRSQNPLHGSPVQVSDLDDHPFPNAGAMGDAATIGLYAAFRRGTDVLSETMVTGITRTVGTSAPGKYRIDLLRGGRPLTVYTDRVVLAPGAGASSLPKDPASRALAQAEMTKLAGGPETLKDVRIITGDLLLRGSNHVADEAAFYKNADGPIFFIAGGDAGKTSVEHFGVATKPGARPPAYWVGVKPEQLVKRYARAGDLLESGAVAPMDGHLTKIEELPGSKRLRLTFETPSGIVTREAGKVVLNLGMDSPVPELVKGVVKDFDPNRNLERVVGVDRQFTDQALAKQIVVDGKKEDIYVVGVASGLERPKGPSFLQYFGWKDVQFTRQVLASGTPEKGPARTENRPAARTLH